MRSGSALKPRHLDAAGASEMEPEQESRVAGIARWKMA